MYVSDELIVVADKQGLSARFEPGVPRPLRDSLVPAALAAGALPVELAEAKPAKSPRKAKTEAPTEAE